MNFTKARPLHGGLSGGIPMEPLSRKATESGGQGTRPQASGCVSLQVRCGHSAPSGALGLSLPEGGRKPAAAKGAVRCAS